MKETLNFFVFNIKLQSDKTGDERTNAYISLIEGLTRKPYKPFTVSKSEAIVLYSSTNTTDGDKSLYLYGRAAKGLYIAGQERQVLNNGEVNVEKNDPHQIINPVQARYIFYPDAHRLFLEKKAKGPSQTDMERYLNEELPKLVDPEDKLEIIIERDNNAIREIFEAKVVHSVSYKVSYTNEDFLDDLAEDFDKELKATNIGELSVTAKADNHLEGLKLDSSKLLGGGIKLAENNGEIRSASITPDDGRYRRKTVTNKDKPKVLTMSYTETDNFWARWYKTVLDIYRNNS